MAKHRSHSIEFKRQVASLGRDFPVGDQEIISMSR